MAGDEAREREVFREFYEKLSVEERRARVILEPKFRDAYNEISQAHRQFPIPAYLWERWVPRVPHLEVQMERDRAPGPPEVQETTRRMRCHVAKDMV